MQLQLLRGMIVGNACARDVVYYKRYVIYMQYIQYMQNEDAIRWQCLRDVVCYMKLDGPNSPWHCPFMSPGRPPNGLPSAHNIFHRFYSVYIINFIITYVQCTMHIFCHSTKQNIIFSWWPSFLRLQIWTKKHLPKFLEEKTWGKFYY